MASITKVDKRVGLYALNGTVWEPVQIAPGGAVIVCPEEHHSCFSEEFTANGMGDIAGTSILRPAPGKRLGIHIIHMTTSGGSGTVSLDFSGSGKKVARMYPGKSSQVDHTQTHDEGTMNEPLTLTVSGIGNEASLFAKIQHINED